MISCHVLIWVSGVGVDFTGEAKNTLLSPLGFESGAQRLHGVKTNWFLFAEASLNRIPSDDLGLAFGSWGKGEDQLDAQNGSGEDDLDLSEKEILPDDLGLTFGILEKGEDEIASKVAAKDCCHSIERKEGREWDRETAVRALVVVEGPTTKEKRREGVWSSDDYGGKGFTSVGGGGDGVG
ncbi:hypothetical protein Droror1_Dr00028046 [Drosera rotundifolia]